MFLQGHEGWVWSVAFTANGKSLVSAGWDGTLRVWQRQERESTVKKKDLMYSRRMRAIASMEIPFGHTASHSPWFEQSPNSSAANLVGHGLHPLFAFRMPPGVTGTGGKPWPL